MPGGRTAELFHPPFQLLWTGHPSLANRLHISGDCDPQCPVRTHRAGPPTTLLCQGLVSFPGYTTFSATTGHPTTKLKFSSINVS